MGQCRFMGTVPKNNSSIFFYSSNHSQNISHYTSTMMIRLLGKEIVAAFLKTAVGYFFTVGEP
jgi:predicted LPLAT superfamily acyltransferase